MHTTLSRDQPPTIKHGQCCSHQHQNQRKENLHAHAGSEHVAAHTSREYNNITACTMVGLMCLHRQLRVLVYDMLHRRVWEIVVVHQQERVLIAYEQPAPALRDV